jgi:hypothetical protein
MTLFDADNFRDFRNVVLQRLLDAHLECDGGGGAADAGTVEADGHDAGLIDVDEFDVTAVALNGGAELSNDVGNAILHVVDGFGHDACSRKRVSSRL